MNSSKPPVGRARAGGHGAALASVAGPGKCWPLWSRVLRHIRAGGVLTVTDLKADGALELQSLDLSGWGS